MSAQPTQSPQRRRVLFLAKLFPWPLNFGARQRVFHLARGIAAGHDVTVVAYDAPPSAQDERAFLDRSACSRVLVVPRNAARPASRGADSRRAWLSGKLASLDERLRSPIPSFVQDAWSDALVAALDDLRRHETLDVVYATQSWMAEHARAAGFERIVVDVDDLVSGLSSQRARSAPWSWRKPVQLFDAAKDARYERSLPKRFARVVVAKDADRDFFAPADRDRVTVVPNGITLPASPAGEPEVANTLLFVGTLGYGPNIDAIRWFAAEMLPLIWARRSDVRFVVAGYGSAATVADVLRDPRCEVYESPADLGPLYDASAVVVAPVRTGGGTRIKILEALGRGRALVSTTFAAEGLDLRGGVELEYADTPAEFARRCVDLLGDQARRRALAAAGRERVGKSFEWGAIERGLPGLVSAVIGP